jgi:hypothetical protein
MEFLYFYYETSKLAQLLQLVSQQERGRGWVNVGGLCVGLKELGDDWADDED